MTDSRAARMAVSLRDFTRVWDDRDPTAIPSIYTPDYRGHGFPVVGTVTRSRYRTLVELFQRAFPDCRVELLEMSADETFVYTSWRFRGTHTGTVAGLAASGATVTFAGEGRHRHEDGAVAEAWLSAEWPALYAGVLRGYLSSVTGPSW